MPLPDILEFADTNVTQRKFQQAQAKLLNFVGELDVRQAATANGYFKSYATLADANADITNIPFGVSVKVLSATEGGDYYKSSATATSLTKSAYDPLTQAKEYTESFSKQHTSDALAKIAEQTKAENLLEFQDGDGGVYAYFDPRSGLNLVGLEGSVQENIKANTGKLITKESSDLYQFEDAEENLVAKIDQNGHLFIVGLDESVQESIKNASKGLTTKVFSSPILGVKSSADLFCTEALASLNYLHNFSEFCEVPNNLLPQQYHINDTWVDEITVPVPTNRVVVGAFNDRGTATNWRADSGVVHPYIIEFKNPLLGYKYWMAITPYTGTNENFELPYVYGSNSDDLDNWELIPELPKPFDVDPKDQSEDPSVLNTSGHLSDPAFTYDSNTGELWLIWRRNLYFDGGRDRTKAKLAILGRKTIDGLNWSDIIEVVPEYTDISKNILSSPSILFNPKDNMFYMHYCTASVNASIAFQKSPSLTNPQWSKAEICTGFDNIDPYHLETKWVGDSIVMLVHDMTNDLFTFAISEDGVNFKNGTPILENLETYKGSFLPRFNADGKMTLDIAYTTTHNATPQWSLYVTKSNELSVGN